MIWATEYKHIELVKLLLAKGSDINIRDNVRFFLESVLEIIRNLCLETEEPKNTNFGLSTGRHSDPYTQVTVSVGWENVLPYSRRSFTSKQAVLHLPHRLPGSSVGPAALGVFLCQLISQSFSSKKRKWEGVDGGEEGKAHPRFSSRDSVPQQCSFSLNRVFLTFSPLLLKPWKYLQGKLGCEELLQAWVCRR